jgi:stress response protein YsnF
VSLAASGAAERRNEGLRVGEALTRRGGASVRIAAGTEAAAPSTPAPMGAAVGDSELAEQGLLIGRVVEVNAMHQEPVVSKGTAVREELVVRKSVDRRTERIDDTLRRTEAEVEALEPPDAAEAR